MIHKEGRIFLVIAAILLITVAVVGWLFIPMVAAGLLIVGALVLLAFLIYFFRNPKRLINVQDNGVISPADGKVVVLEEADEPEVLGQRCLQVSIFLSPLNVHVNRSTC